MSKGVYQVALTMLPGIGSVLAKQLVSYCGSAEQVFRTPKGKLLRIPGIGDKLADGIVSQQVLSSAEKEVALLEKEGGQVLFFTDESYPERLKKIHDAPVLLYWKGNASLNAVRTVAIVGTRKATEYGKSIVDEIVRGLSKYNDLLIVSGLAYGIDIHAHREALYSQIPNVAVMGAGLTTIYPAAHTNTARQLVDNGGLLTEYRLGVAPDAPHFPERNRIIAGLADAVIVVEAADAGGALITAEIANQYNKEVFAVPGRLIDRYSLGCNRLIREHKAHIYNGLKEFEEMMNWDLNQPPHTHKPTINLTLSPEEQRLYALLEGGEKHIDDLSHQTQIPVGKLASILLNMEFAGVVKALPGKRFSLA